MDLTDDEELVEIFTNCKFYENVEGISVCRGYCLPCRKVIEKGHCDVLIKYFNKEDV